MSDIVSLKRKPHLRIVGDEPPVERVFGSPEFIARGRNLALPQPPRRFVPTIKKDGDIVL